MFGLIRLTGYFIFSTLILSIPFNGSPLFYSVQKYSTPITKTVILKVKRIYGNLINEKNSKSEIQTKIDEISSSLSSTKRKVFKNSPDREKRKNFFRTKKFKPHDEYAPSEKRLLEKILEGE